MSTEQITALIVAIMPAISAIVAVVTLVFNVVRQFKELRQDVKDTQAETVTQLLKENYELKKQIRKLIEIETKVKQKEE